MPKSPNVLKVLTLFIHVSAKSLLILRQCLIFETHKIKAVRHKLPMYHDTVKILLFQMEGIGG